MHECSYQTQYSMAGGQIEEFSPERLVGEQFEKCWIEAFDRIPSAQSDEQQVARLRIAAVLSQQ